MFNTEGKDSTFKKGDVIAATLDLPAGEDLMMLQQQIGYYGRFVPTLVAFTEFLKSKGHKDADLHIGEDVGQLDVVACAAPHWNPDFLGGKESKTTIINNCVSTNGWSIKQPVQTRPAMLYLVGESSYDMFRQAFGNLIHRDTPLSFPPGDNLELVVVSETFLPCT